MRGVVLLMLLAVNDDDDDVVRIRTEGTSMSRPLNGRRSHAGAQWKYSLACTPKCTTQAQAALYKVKRSEVFPAWIDCVPKNLLIYRIFAELL